jgi:hypothetical protein
MSDCPADPVLLARLISERSGKRVQTLAFPQNIKPGLSGASLWLAHLRDEDGFRFGVLKIPAEGREKDVVLDNEGFSLMKGSWQADTLPRQHFLFRHEALVEGRPGTAVTFCSFADEHCAERPVTLGRLMDTDIGRAQACLEAVYRCYEVRLQSAFGLGESRVSFEDEPSISLRSTVRRSYDLICRAINLNRKEPPGSRGRSQLDENGEFKNPMAAQFKVDAPSLRSLSPQAHMRNMIHPDLLAQVQSFDWHRFSVNPHSPIREVDRAVYPNSLVALNDPEMWKSGQIELALVPIHGDLNPENIVIVGDCGFVFVDFEKTRRGVPQYDLAFLLMWLIKRLCLDMANRPDDQEILFLARLARNIASSFGSGNGVLFEDMGHRERNLIEILHSVFVPMTRMVDVTASPLEFQRKGARLALAVSALARSYYEFRDASRSDGGTRRLREISGQFYYDLSCCVLDDEGLFDSGIIEPRAVTRKLDSGPDASLGTWSSLASELLELTVFDADGVGVRRFRLEEGENRVGVRSVANLPDIDLTPFDRMKVISRRHAVITVCSGRATVRDLKSSNGTSIDGTKIGGQPVELTETSDLAFADIHCRVGATRTGGSQVIDGAKVGGNTL